MDPDLEAGLRAALDVDPEAYQDSVREEAERIKSELAAGTFDNSQAIVGLEYEFYAVTGDRWAAGDGADGGHLARVPRRLLEYIGFEKEIGLHNAEMSTSPQPFNRHGLAAQESEVRARLSAATDVVRAEGLALVSDGLWTIPPMGETARGYLTDSVVVDGLRYGTNMSASPRYHGFANSEFRPRMEIDAPHVHVTADVPMLEGLITSIQPHYQVSAAADLPVHFRYALRVAAPLVALGANSPLFPPDLYDEGADPAAVLADGWDESRIDVFESVLNPVDGPRKVRFPRDVPTVEAAVDRVAEDPPMVPMPVEGGGDRFDDAFPRFRHKHGTFWRWIRPVFEGATRSSANARIEFRPIPAQPTVRDSIAFQAAFAGLLQSLPAREHPVYGMDWETARENFYRAARDGTDADLVWIGNDGGETTDPERIYRDLLAHAEDGLSMRGLSEDRAGAFLQPLRRRAGAGVSPADWKRVRVRERLDDGEPFAEAVYGMQREYLDCQLRTLLEGSFGDWFDARAD